MQALEIDKDINAQAVDRLMRVLGADHNDALGVKVGIVKALQQAGINIAKLNIKIGDYIRRFQNEGLGNPTIRARAIYAIHSLASKLNKVKDGAASAALLIELHEGRTINKLQILGDFPLIDFSDLQFVECHFNGYQRLLECKANSGTSFKRSSFSNCSAKLSQSDLLPSMFDDECIMDEGMRVAVNCSADKKEGRNLRLQSDLKRVLKALRSGLGFGSLSLNRIKLAVTLSSGEKMENFLDQLCRMEILLFDSLSSLYRVNDKAHKDAVALSFPWFFVFQEVGFMLPVFPHAEH